jgi:hypothetical protein
MIIKSGWTELVYLSTFDDNKIYVFNFVFSEIFYNVLTYEIPVPLIKNEQKS